MEEKKKPEEIMIVKNSLGEYLVLKRGEDGKWKKPGERKTLGELSYLFSSGEFAVTLDEIVFYEIKAYQKKQERKEGSLSARGLESKTI